MRTVCSGLAIVGLSMLLSACDNECLGGEWETLSQCVDAKIDEGVDDICECETNNWPNGPWFMTPDDDDDDDNDDNDNDDDNN
ncbi:MAG: hypothetical protein MK135_09195 [Polyangiaceae bacterium]|nr:hypothetical protein [Polyangiaceae bacterium]